MDFAKNVPKNFFFLQTPISVSKHLLLLHCHCKVYWSKNLFRVRNNITRFKITFKPKYEIFFLLSNSDYDFKLRINKPFFFYKINWQLFYPIFCW